MSIDKFSDQCLKEMIHALPQKEVPEEVSHRIMVEIRSSQQTIGYRIYQFLTRSRTIDFQPVRLASAVCVMAFVFWLGLIIGNNGSDPADVSQNNFKPLNNFSENAEASFFIGKGFLAMGKWEEAVPYLQKASTFVPENPEYALWEGVAVGKSGNKKVEHEIYTKTLEKYPGYIPARLFLGHFLLENGQPDAALEEYSRVLFLQPDIEAALYNRALAYQLTGQKNQEAEAWKKYLDLHRTGSWAYRAVNHLNELGDFTFRTYQIGFRRVILNQELLLGPDSEKRQNEIDFLADMFVKGSGNKLELVVFQSNNAFLASEHARELKNKLLASLGDKGGKKVNVTWFDQLEEVRSSSGKLFSQKKSLLIFSKPQIEKSEENTI